jgi:AcrR family transcriptional regulator
MPENTQLEAPADSVGHADGRRCRYPGCDREPAASAGDGGRLPVYCDDPAHNTRSAYRKRQGDKAIVPAPKDSANSAASREDNSRKRSEILQLSAVEFSEKGFHATTIRDLSKAVGLTQPMLYYYVGNKDAFLLAICEELLSAHIAAVSHLENSSRPPAERLENFFAIELTLAEEHKPEVTVYLRERQTLPEKAKRRIREKQATLERVLRTILAQGIERGQLEVPSLETAEAAIWAVLSSSVTTRSSDQSASEQASKLSALLLRGLLPRA